MSIEIRDGRYVLDLRGYVCPYPQILTLKALKRLNEGAELEVIIDNPASCENVPAVLKKEGHEVLGVERIEPGVWRIRVVKHVSRKG
jgi:tRNA 2-thiouridine synthesizing protein A